MKKFILIRHGLTAGNKEGRYIGRTDEPLCPDAFGKLLETREMLADVRSIAAIYASPYRRCTETAAFLFPSRKIRIVRDLRECDFGNFEGKSAAELADNPYYEKWVSDNCMTPIPGGEDVSAFRKRCCSAFAGIAAQLPDGETAAVVTHGGSIMAILEKLARPKKEFCEYHIGNGGVFFCDDDGSCLNVTGGF